MKPIEIIRLCDLALIVACNEDVTTQERRLLESRARHLKKKAIDELNGQAAERGGIGK